ncbi:MFS transporter [Staphylococcus arlettae]|uniref:MFS transporter n=1 Tax=Staphylococcus arlettae TaxID=29378 RepID=UPI000DCCCEFB|nr:MFS transporter [Staphylococcus arlettae]RBA01393.1 putative MFS-type transporter YhjX [Staphylococcus arlettae]RBA02038.1 putative MFS-type transporter YhjX [Staphylococcus arlettae]RBA06442.1 putative MFS-type transporter YhjX [Staphylococcus arlettae]
MKTKNFYYGWVIVFIAGLTVFLSGPGQTYSNAAFIDEYIQTFGWSRTEVSSIYALATLIAGFTMIIVGRFIDKFGQKKMILLAGSLLALSCFLNSMISNTLMLFIGFFLIRLFGQGSMTLIPNTLVPQWFIQKRGLAFSMMTLGSFVSAMIFPIINVWLISQWGWRFAWQFWGILILLLFIPIVWLFTYNKPEELKLLPDGKKAETSKNRQENNTILEESWTLKEATKTNTFWMLLVCVGIPSMVNTGITFHIVSIFNDNGLNASSAAIVLSLMAIVGIPMSFVSGIITDKIKTNYILLTIFIIEIGLLLLLNNVLTYSLAILFGIIWGIANGLERIGTNIVWANYFGRKHVGSINGIGSTMLVIGSSLGPLPLGLGHDIFQSYSLTIYMMILFPIIGLVCALLAKKPVKNY